MDRDRDDGPGSALDRLLLLSFLPDGTIPYLANNGSFKTSRADGLKSHINTYGVRRTLLVGFRFWKNILPEFVLICHDALNSFFGFVRKEFWNCKFHIHNPFTSVFEICEFKRIGSSEQ